MTASPFLDACQRLAVGRTPVWFMRQAGRYLPEYRAIRERASLLEICHRPDLAAEVTLQPLARFPLDAAIIFADILLPFEPLGLGLEFVANEGPVIRRPIRTPADVAQLPHVDPTAELEHVLDAIRRTREALRADVALIGFAGAPFTLASYAIEGGASRSFAETKRFMYNAPAAWEALLDRLATLVGRYLAAQVAAGAQAVQLFDSWVGCLSPTDYRRFVRPHSAKVFAALRDTGAPTIHFGTDTAALLDLMTGAGGDVIGVDWRVPLDDAWARFPERAIQGNLDPCALLAPRHELREQVHRVLRQAAGRPGHIFNLGHGVLPMTSPDAVRATIEMVHEWEVAHV